MSDPGMLEEWYRRNGTSKRVSPKENPTGSNTEAHECAKMYDNQYATGLLKLIESKKELKYDIDEDGNLREVSILYDINGRKFNVSIAMCECLDPYRDHIRLEIKREYKNPLKNILGKNLLTSSVTPVHIPAYERGCLWKYIKCNKINYPSDENYKVFVDATIACIKSLTYEIENEMKSKVNSKDNRVEEVRSTAKQTLIDDNLKEQDRLKRKKRKEREYINFWLYGSNVNKR